MPWRSNIYSFIVNCVFSVGLNFHFGSLKIIHYFGALTKMSAVKAAQTTTSLR